VVDRRYYLSGSADADLERLYEWGVDHFGANRERGGPIL
jgi:hypothetical protein